MTRGLLGTTLLICASALGAAAAATGAVKATGLAAATTRFPSTLEGKLKADCSSSFSNGDHGEYHLSIGAITWKLPPSGGNYEVKKASQVSLTYTFDYASGSHTYWTLDTSKPVTGFLSWLGGLSKGYLLVQVPATEHTSGGTYPTDGGTGIHKGVYKVDSAGKVTAKFTDNYSTGEVTCAKSADFTGQLEDPHIASVKTSGTPVVRDRSFAQGGGKQTVDQGRPCGDAQTTWADCEPDGKPEWVWPVLLQRGGSLNVTQLKIKVKGDQAFLDQYDGKDLKGEAPAAGVTYNGKVSKSGDALVATGLSASGTLPDEIKPLDLSITWTMGKDSQKIDLGSTTQRVYLVDSAAQARDSMLSILDLTTSAAQGQKGAKAVFDAVWNAFEGRNLHRVDLDPATGDVAQGALLKYYPPWSLQKFFDGTEGLPGQCTTGEYAVLNILSSQDNVGVCNDWAKFFIAALGSQGLGGSEVDVGTTPQFFKYVVPAKYKANSVMLVNPWKFFGPRRQRKEFPDFEYLDTVRLSPFAIADRGFDYPGTTDGIGQGSVKWPRGLFASGDHAVVRVQEAGGQLYDPSYGTGPFVDVLDWANHALDGYGLLVPADKEGHVVHSRCVPPRAEAVYWCYFYATRTLAAGKIRPAVFSFKLENNAFVLNISKAAKLKITIRKGKRRLGVLKRRAHPSLNRIPFAGRVRGKKLKAGRYRATLVAVDKKGRKSKPVSARFRIRRR